MTEIETHSDQSDDLQVKSPLTGETGAKSSLRSYVSPKAQKLATRSRTDGKTCLGPFEGRTYAAS